MTDNPKIWSFNPPKECDKNPVKLFALQKPYYGPRINSTVLQMPIRWPSVKHTKGLSSAKNIEVPENWSWRKRGTNKIEKGGLRDQGECGGCWAFSVASSLGDRYALKYNIASPYLSSAWLISTAKPAEVASNVECKTGGNTYTASKWLESNSLKLEKCWPYSIIRNKGFISPEPLNILPDDCCFNCCGEYVYELSNLKFSCLKDSTKYIVNADDISNEFSGTKSNNAVINVKSTIKSIKIEIMNFGPVVSSFSTYDDFLTYWKEDAASGKIYTRKSNKYTGGHAVVLTGWGKENGIEYWEVRNSWGKTGDNGYCKIAMSTSTPKDKWIEIDIPKYERNIWMGGVVSFLPGELNNKKFFEKGIDYEEEKKIGVKEKEIEIDYEEEKKIGVKEKEKEIKGEDNKKVNITYIIIFILLFILICIIIYKLVSKNINSSIITNNNEFNNNNLTNLKNKYTVPY